MCNVETLPHQEERGVRLAGALKANYSQAALRKEYLFACVCKRPPALLYPHRKWGHLIALRRAECTQRGRQRSTCWPKAILSPLANIRTTMTYIELRLSASTFIRVNVQQNMPKQKVCRDDKSEVDSQRAKIIYPLMPKTSPISHTGVEISHMLQNVSTAHRQRHFSLDNWGCALYLYNVILVSF